MIADTHDRVDASCELVQRKAPEDAHVLWTNLHPLRYSVGRATTAGARVEQDFIVTPQRGRTRPLRRKPLWDVAVGAPDLFSSNFRQGRIVRNDPDGGGQVNNLVRGLGSNRVTGVTATSQHVFWLDARAKRIGRATTDGANRDRSFINRLSAIPNDIATDGTFLYWTTTLGTIARANVDGSGVDERFIDLGGRFLPEIALGIDTYGGLVYWASPAYGVIGRARSDGTDVQTRFLGGVGLGTTGVAVDGRHIFWTRPVDGTIGRANLDGSNPTRGLVRDQPIPYFASVERIPRAVIAPAERDFGMQPVGAGQTPSQSFQVTSTGNAPLVLGRLSLGGVDPGDFAITGDTCSGGTLAPDASCVIDVAFDPTAAGGRSAEVRVPSDDPDAPLLTGSVVGEGTVPGATITPADNDYGAREVGTGPSAPAAFTVGSTGTAPLAIGDVSVGGGDGSFAVASDTCSRATLNPGATCRVGVTFAPTGSGAKVASLIVPGGGPGAPTLTARLTGSGTSAAAALVPRLVRFDEREVGSGPSDPTRLHLESVGTAPLRVTGVVIGGANPGDFRITSDACSGRAIAPGASCPIEVVFQPQSPGGLGATLDVVADDPGLSNPAASADLAGTASSTPPPPQPPPQPVPTPAPIPSPIVAGCGAVTISGMTVQGQRMRTLNGVRQPFVTRNYNGSMVVEGTSTCASGQVVALWGPKLNERSGVRLKARTDARGIEIVARATVQDDGRFRLPTDTRPPGQYFVAFEGVEPLTGSPLWLQINPILKATRNGARVTAFAGPPVATAGARVVLQRNVGGTWRGVDSATVSRRARANLVAPSAPGTLRVRLTPTTGLDQQQSLMTGRTASVG